MKQTERLALEAVLGSQELLRRLADRILQDAIFVYPTETIYGIGGRAENETVEKQIIIAKKRRHDSRMICVAGSLATLESADVVFSDTARRLAKRFWPGWLTLVLPRAGGDGWLGVRLSDHPLIIALDTVLACPFFSTSANISGKPYDGDPGVIYRIFKHRVDFMIDAGPLPPSPPSTVVRVCSDGAAEVLREGAISSWSVHSAMEGN